MELKINCNAFIKLSNFLGISSVNHQIAGYDCRNETLEGKLIIEGKYYQSSTLQEQEHPFQDEVPFVVIFNDENRLINTVNCENFEYYEVVGRGIDVNFDIVVHFNAKENELGEKEKEDNEEEDRKIPDIDEVELEIIKDDEILDLEPKLNDDEIIANEEVVAPKDEIDEAVQNEKLKATITSKIDTLLAKKLTGKTDNLPTEETIGRSIATKKDVIRICYYNDDKDLDDICTKYDISMDKVLHNKNDKKAKRVIIGID